MKIPFRRGEDACDWWFQLGRFTLFVWKPDPWSSWWKPAWKPARKQFGVGRDFGDGLMAIGTPWFLLYLE